MRNIFEDEIDYYGIRSGEREKDEQKEEEKKQVFEANPINDEKDQIKSKFKPINLDNIDLESFSRPEFIDTDEYRYSVCSHPFYKISQTLLLIAEVYASRS